jgi:C-terminal processing protease CtpA/Prc
VKATFAELVSQEVGTYVAPGATVETKLTIGQQGRLVATVADPAVQKVLARIEGGVGPGFIVTDKVGQHFEKMLAPGTYRLFAELGDPSHGYRFVESTTAVIRAGEITTATLGDVFADGGLAPALDTRMHSELGSGLSFENSPGGVRVDFLMSECPAAKAGVRIGDLVVAIDGEAARNALDAFARVRKSGEGVVLELLVRRDGQDLKLTVH